MTRPVRKVAVAAGTRELLRDYAWRQRTSMSAVVTEICRNLVTNPRYYEAYSDDDAALTDSLTLYVPEEPWQRARDVLYFARIPLSQGIREGIRAVLAEERIPK
jgi:hypothetical protein